MTAPDPDACIAEAALEKIRDDLVSELGITDLQARAYLQVTCGGRASSDVIAARLDVSAQDAQDAAESLVELGAFIELGNDNDGRGGAFEAMHPRFTAVNMLRRTCERRGRQFGRNRIMDAVGAALEAPYDSARTNKGS